MTTAQTTTTATSFEILYTHPRYFTQESLEAKQAKDGRWRVFYRGAMALNLCEAVSLKDTREEAEGVVLALALERGWIKQQEPEENEMNTYHEQATYGSNRAAGRAGAEAYGFWRWENLLVLDPEMAEVWAPMGAQGDAGEEATASAETTYPVYTLTAPSLTTKAPLLTVYLDKTERDELARVLRYQGVRVAVGEATATAPWPWTGRTSRQGADCVFLEIEETMVVNLGTELEPRWRVVCGGVEVGGGPSPEYLAPYVEELRADPAKAQAVRAAFLRSEVSRG